MATERAGNGVVGAALKRVGDGEMGMGVALEGVGDEAVRVALEGVRGAGVALKRAGNREVLEGRGVRKEDAEEEGLRLLLVTVVSAGVVEGLMVGDGAVAVAAPGGGAAI